MTAQEYLADNFIEDVEIKRVNGVIGLTKRLSDILEDYHQSKCTCGGYPDCICTHLEKEVK